MYNNRKKNSQAPRKTKAEVAEEKATIGYESIKRSYPWKTTWITDQADKELTYFAEELGKTLADKNYGLTNSKIRSIYGEIKRIQTSGYEKQKPSFIYFAPRWHTPQDVSSRMQEYNFLNFSLKMHGKRYKMRKLLKISAI